MSYKMNPKKCVIVMLVFFVSIGSNAKADFVFGTPTRLGPPVNSSSIETEPSISSDGLELFFDSSRSPKYGSWDLWVSTRATTDDDWGSPKNLGPIVNHLAYDLAPSISSDGLSLYFCSNRSGGWDIWVTTRAATDQPWEAPTKLQSPVNSANVDVAHISPDGLELYIGSDRPGGYGDCDLWVSKRATTKDDWGEPVNLGSKVNAASGEIYSSISADGRLLFFSGGEAPPRASGYGKADIWMTTRKSRDAEWSTPMNLGPNVNSSFIDRAPSISADGSMLYFYSDRSGNDDLWQVTIEPVVDLNGDGIVDATDMCIMVDYWGTDEPLCDIGPMPWGDGVVDVQDLIVLAEYLLPVLAAHWELDEIEGNIAYNSIDENNGTLSGNPTWQPGGGRIGGALQFDGIGDYVSTRNVLNPKFAQFSVFAWIKGGSPGQVIISQKNSMGGSGATWLGADASDGRLITTLTSQATGPLESEFVITDDQWHHVGFVWDGSYRQLYVDGIQVAQDADAMTSLIPSTGGMYIGVAKDRNPASFFSGLIDDVRIYRRVLRAEEIAALAQ